MIFALALIAVASIASVTTVAMWAYLCQFRIQERLMGELRESNRKMLTMMASDAARHSAVMATPAPIAPEGSNSREPETVRPRMSR